MVVVLVDQQGFSSSFLEEMVRGAFTVTSFAVWIELCDTHLMYVDSLV